MKIRAGDWRGGKGDWSENQEIGEKPQRSKEGSFMD